LKGRLSGATPFQAPPFLGLEIWSFTGAPVRQSLGDGGWNLEFGTFKSALYNFLNRVNLATTNRIYA
jgi:hypothetical protein